MLAKEKDHMNTQDPEMAQNSYSAANPDDTLIFVGPDAAPILDVAGQLVPLGMFMSLTTPNSNPPLSPIAVERVVLGGVPDLISSVRSRLARLGLAPDAPFGFGVILRDKAHRLVRAQWFSGVTVVGSSVETKAGASYAVDHLMMTATRVQGWDVASLLG